MRYIQLLLVVIMCSFTPPAMAAVKCTCPSIAADGEGNSSCSAAESNSRCTVDFNLFGEREMRAFDFITSSGASARIGDPSLPTFESLIGLSPEDLVLQIKTFLAVAAVDQLTSAPDSLSVGDLVALLNGAADRYFNEISLAFDSQAMSMGDGPFVNNDDAVIAPGCVEFRVPGLWVMFKANWSPVAEQPRCGGNTLSP